MKKCRKGQKFRLFIHKYTIFALEGIYLKNINNKTNKQTKQKRKKKEKDKEKRKGTEQDSKPGTLSKIIRAQG